MRLQKLVGAYELDVGDNIVEINVISENSSASKIYRINVYRKSKQETLEYNQKQEENEEIVQEIINNQVIDESYNTERTKLTVSYINNNEIIKIMILMFILCTIVMIIVSKKLINIKYRQK